MAYVLRHAIGKRPPARLPRRALLIFVGAAVAGPLAYILLPIPSGAAPGTPVPVVTPAAAAMAPAAPALEAGLVGGRIEIDDLTENPIGVVSSTPTAAVDGPIGFPVSDHTPTTGFGYRSDPFTHRQRWHDGVDLGQPCNDPAWASLEGTVEYAGWAGGYGNRIVLRHADRSGHTFETVYSHLNLIEVSVGQQVKQGDVIAKIGSTGRSTACHMHFEVILDGSYVDPMRFLTGDQSKAQLSRRVGSRMPQGLPSPSGNPSTTSATPSPTASKSKTPTPSPSTPTPTSPTPSPGTSSAPESSPGEPVQPTTPSASETTPEPSSPDPSTPDPSSPDPSSSEPSTPAASETTPEPHAQTPDGGSQSSDTASKSSDPGSGSASAP